MMEKKNVPKEYSLRIGVRGAGCMGVRHFLAFDKKKTSDDSSTIKGIPVIYEKKQALYLAGYKIEFEDSNEEKGFFFSQV